MNSIKNIEKIFNDSIAIKSSIVASPELKNLVKMGNIAIDSIMSGGKILLCGNGGSAADAQHLAAEMLVRLRPKNNREGVPALALAQDTSTITACGNDFGFESLFERLVKTIGSKNDILIAITTSGNSENIIRAMKASRQNDIKVFGFLGSDGGNAMELCDEVFLVPSSDTGRIQESHITAGHALMEYIEDGLIANDYLHLQK
jgi:D-sedoheptulose 7-phosphate isomerase